MKKLFEALQGGSLTLVLVLLWSRLLAEGERCNTTLRGVHGFHLEDAQYSGRMWFFLMWIWTNSASMWTNH